MLASASKAAKATRVKNCRISVWKRASLTHQVALKENAAKFTSSLRENAAGITTSALRENYPLGP
jgi:hypothetical protein